MNNLNNKEKDIKNLKKTLKGLPHRFENNSLLEENFKILFKCFYEVYEKEEEYKVVWWMLEAFRKVIETLYDRKSKTKNKDLKEKIGKYILLVEALKDKFAVYAYSFDD